MREKFYPHNFFLISQLLVFARLSGLNEVTFGVGECHHKYFAAALFFRGEIIVSNLARWIEFGSFEFPNFLQVQLKLLPS
jgi:hypothetical protein